MKRHVLQKSLALLGITLALLVAVISAAYREFGGGAPVHAWISEHPTTTLAERSISLNTATKEELLQLPNMTEEIADKILAYRNEFVIFRELDDLRSISGVTEYVYLTWYPYLTLF